MKLLKRAVCLPVLIVTTQAAALANTEQEVNAVDPLFPFFPFTAKGQTKRLVSAELIGLWREILPAGCGSNYRASR